MSTLDCCLNITDLHLLLNTQDSLLFECEERENKLKKIIIEDVHLVVDWHFQC
jgi:hypothetical protein